jgi:endonuclease/exonuclease/phosphatase family metal-dependent hydrolase
MQNKRFLFVIILVALAFVQTALAERITFATWNIRFANEEDSLAGNAWSVRAEKIAEMVHYFDFDILVVQEPDSQQVLDLAALLPEYTYIQTDPGKIHPIYFKKDKFKAVKSGQFWYSESGNPGEKGWDARHVRFCSWVNLRRNKKRFFVFNSHWDNIGKEARNQSANVALKQVGKIAGRNRVIFAGDMNTQADSKAVTTLNSTNLLKDAKELAKVKRVPTGSFTNFDVNDGANRQIDHISVTPSIPVYKYGILDNRYYDGKTWRYPSDHMPVVIEFELK